MRLCAFLEAWVQLVVEEGTGMSPERVPRKGVTGLITHHKVAVARSQPWRGRPIEAGVTGRGLQKHAVWNRSRRSASALSPSIHGKLEMSDAIRPLIAGNWKMNGLKASMAEFDAMLAGAGAFAGKADLLVCPPATLVAAFADKARRGRAVAVGAQDCHPRPAGAH